MCSFVSVFRKKVFKIPRDYLIFRRSIKEVTGTILDFERLLLNFKAVGLWLHQIRDHSAVVEVSLHFKLVLTLVQFDFTDFYYL